MDKILLRFRDLTQGVDTIATHNEIAKEKQRVLWGWWKKEAEPLPDPTLAELAWKQNVLIITKINNCQHGLKLAQLNRYRKENCQSMYYQN